MSRRDSEATKDALLTAGAALFADRGFDGATLDLIARKARVNKAMVNYHFGGKKGLYTAILGAAFSSLEDRLGMLRDSPRPADELLREFVALFAEMAGDHPTLPVMLVREVISGGEHLDRSVLPHILAIFGTVRGIVEKGIREGTFRAVDPLLTHLTLIGSLVFFFATERFRGRAISAGHLPVEAPSPEAFVRHIQELVARGLAPQTERAS